MLNEDSYKKLMQQGIEKGRPTFRLDDPRLFDLIATQHIPPGPGPELRPMPAGRTVEATMLGKLDWSAIPFDQPIPLDRGRRGAGRILAVLAWVVVKGICPISGTNGSPASTTSASA